MLKIEVTKLEVNATVPTRANTSDAGWDLYASESLSIDPNDKGLVSTKIAMAIPEGYVGLIWDRSGVAAKRGVHRFAGVIDSGYRGEIKVCLWNSSAETFVINEGDRIAQLLIQEVPALELVEVDSLDSTERGDGGFGSSGV